MSGSIARRAVPLILVASLLLPVAGFAAPVRQRGEGPAAIGMAEWSRALFRTVDHLVDLLRPAWAASNSGHKKPGDDNGGGQGREGNGIDPHGKPGGK